MKRLRDLGALSLLSVGLVLLPGMSNQAFADYSSTTTTTTTTTTTPMVGSSTTEVTTTDQNLQSTTTTVRGSDGMLYTTTVVPTVEVDAFRTGRADIWGREGFGSMYDLNNDHSQAFMYGAPITVDLKQNRALVMMSDDGLYEPAALLSDGFSRGLNSYPVTQFSAQRIEIETGTTVTFWADTDHHGIDQLDGPVMMSGEAIIDTSRTFSHTFNTPGDYRFIDGFGGGPMGSESPGIIIHVTGPQRYTYAETTTTVAYLDTTTSTVSEEKRTEISTQPSVQVEAAKPKPKVVKPHKVLRNRDVK
jgi:hypothetical protein